MWVWICSKSGQCLATCDTFRRYVRKLSFGPIRLTLYSLQRQHVVFTAAPARCKFATLQRLLFCCNKTYFRNACTQESRFWQPWCWWLRFILCCQSPLGVPILHTNTATRTRAHTHTHPYTHTHTHTHTSEKLLIIECLSPPPYSYTFPPSPTPPFAPSTYTICRLQGSRPHLCCRGKLE